MMATHVTVETHRHSMLSILLLLVITWSWHCHGELLFQRNNVDGLMQKRHNFTGNALELHLFCIRSSICTSVCNSDAMNFERYTIFTAWMSFVNVRGWLWFMQYHSSTLWTYLAIWYDLCISSVHINSIPPWQNKSNSAALQITDSFHFPETKHPTFDLITNEYCSLMLYW